MKIQLLLKQVFLLCMFVVSSSVWGQTTGTVTITRANFTSGALAYGTDDLWTATSSTGETITGYFDIFSTAGQTTMQTRTSTPIGSYPYNTVALPGAIKSIVLTGGGTGTARTWTPFLSTSQLTKANYSSGTSQGAQTASSNSASTTWTVDTSLGFNYFYINMTGGAAYLNSIVITYEMGVTAPTITASPASVPNLTAAIGASDTEVIEITGSSLTGNISTAITGTNADQFSVTPVTLPSTGGNLTVTYTPTTLGNHTATLTLLSAGAEDVVLELTGLATLAAPVATAATDVSTTSFVANWNAVPGAESYVLDVYQSTGTPATDLIISEYVEGSSGNNKAIEIFNGTGAAVDLSTYSMRKQSNGAGDYIDDLPLVGTLQNGETYVIANSGAESSILGVADLTTAGSPINFNGNDAVALFKNGTKIDEIGVYGQTSDWGKDVTLRRMSSINEPNATYNTSEWESFAANTFEGLGSHTFSGSTKTFIIENQNVGAVTSYPVTGLVAESTYKYVVRAVAGATTSSDSNEIEVTTTAVPAITWNGTDWSNGTGPNATTPVVIEGNYSIVDSFEAQSVTINSGITLTIENFVKTGNVNNAGAIIVNNGASFIQTSAGNYSGTGTFTVNRESISPVNKYAFWSSPVVGQNMFDIFPTTAAYVMTYNTATNFYDTLTNPATAAPGVGYSIKTPAAAPTATFAGAPNNGTIGVTLSTASLKYNLVGNPYPSNLDLAAFYTANTANIGSTLYFWDNTGGSVTTQTGGTAVNSGYAIYNAQSGTWNAAPNGSATPTVNYAKIGQGFIVEAVGTSLAFDNTLRVANAGENFNKNSTAAAGEGKYWLTLSSSYNAKVTQAVTYQNGASNEFDSYDSKAMNLGSDAFYSFVGAEKVVIQGKAPFNTDDVVQLGNKHFENGTFQIELTQKEGLFADGQAIYLKDNLLGTEVNLQDGAYSFTSDAGDFSNRFEIAYTQRVLGTDTSVKNELSVYRQGEDFVINSSSKINSVEVYDASGRLIKSFKGNGNKQSVTNLGKGVYILHIQTATENVSKKVIK